MQAGVPSMLVPFVSTPSLKASRATGIKRSKLGDFGHSVLKCTLSRSSIWELRSDVPRWNEESPGLHRSWVVPACKHKRTLQMVRRRIAKRQGAYRKLHKLRPGQPGAMVCGREGAPRPHAGVARDLGSFPCCWGRKAGQVKMRSKFYAKNVETAKSSKLALAEELATLGGCETHLSPQPGNVAYGRGRAGLCRLQVGIVLHRSSCSCDMLSLTFAISPSSRPDLQESQRCRDKGLRAQSRKHLRLSFRPSSMIQTR